MSRKYRNEMMPNTYICPCEQYGNEFPAKLQYLRKVIWRKNVHKNPRRHNAGRDNVLIYSNRNIRLYYLVCYCISRTNRRNSSVCSRPMSLCRPWLPAWNEKNFLAATIEQ